MIALRGRWPSRGQPNPFLVLVQTATARPSAFLWPMPSQHLPEEQAWWPRTELNRRTPAFSELGFLVFPIGHEPPIELWLPLKYPSRLPCLKTRLAWSPPDDESYRNGRQLRSETSPANREALFSEVGWISRQNLLALRSRENFFLDIP